MSDTDAEKKGGLAFDTPTSRPSSPEAGIVGEAEVFSASEGGVNFRNVGWIKAAIFLLKMTFAAGVLSLPTALYELGAVAGAIFILFWSIVNTYMAALQGQFKLKHRSVHTVADSAEIAALQLTGGNKTYSLIAREVAEVIYIIAWILCAGLSTLGLSIALNAVTMHGTCSVVFGFCSYFIIATVASIRKIEKLAWVSWIGFVSIVVAILTVLIATAVRDRPAAAPQTGDFDLGFSAYPQPSATFASAWAASLIIYASSANTSGYVPVISEMRRPQDYFKSLYLCMSWIFTSYMVIGLVMFRFAGKWLSTPALGSAGSTIKIVSYGIAIPGLIAGAMICVHISGKSVFVRILRNSPHLTANTWQHWTVWLSATYGTGLLGWLICEAVPFYGSMISIIGSLGFGPLGICLPVILWFAMEQKRENRKNTMGAKAMWWGHALLFLLGLFVTIGGLYASVVTIHGQFQAGTLGSSFQCADNSNTVASG